MKSKYNLKPSKNEFKRLDDQLFAILKTKLPKCKLKESSPIAAMQKFNKAKMARDRKRMFRAIYK